MVTLPFENRFTRSLPADGEAQNRRRQVAGAAFSRVLPTPVAAPKTLAWSPEVAALLGIPEEVCRSDDFAQVFAGNRLPEGADPYASNYGGHQFGNWAGQLGDGRAIALGEVRDAQGGFQTLQLKGAGPTPYSRHADGRAVLRSSLREFLCSEAMAHLGIPTTRALSLVATGDDVMRDVLYDGHPKLEPGAVVCRVAPSFTRFGHFQLPASRNDLPLLKALVEFTLRADFPGVDGSEATFEQKVARMFEEVCVRTARLLVDWMRVGFVHGVLNTDNMSITGLTIDYGPYGWLEDFDPAWTPNTTDAQMRRYRYGAQPSIAQWNLLQLAQALVPLTQDPKPLQAALVRYQAHYERDFVAMTVARLGWGEVREGDEERLTALFETLGLTETDQVIFYRQLASVPVAEDASDDARLAVLSDAFYAPDEVTGEVRARVAGWLRDWAARAREGGRSDDERQRRMNALNPRFVLRNYLAQEAIDAAEAGNLELMHALWDVLRRPYDEQPGKERFCARRPEWARHKVGSSMLSCSS